METHELFVKAVMEHRITRALVDQGNKGIVEKILVPVDFSPRRKFANSDFAYRFCDPTGSGESSVITILPEALLDLSMLGEMFTPADYAEWKSGWNLPREEKTQAEKVLVEAH